MNELTFIKNGQKIVDIFGNWLDFHDDILSSINFILVEKKILLTIKSSKKDANITFKLGDVFDFKIENVERNNVNFNIIFSLSFNINEEESIHILLESSVGVFFEAWCKKVEIL